MGYSKNLALVFFSGKVYYNTRDQERISKIQSLESLKRSAKIMGMRSFFNGLVNARMVELESEHINAKTMNRTNRRGK